jgi:hypothetical protein
VAVAIGVKGLRWPKELTSLRQAHQKDEALESGRSTPLNEEDVAAHSNDVDAEILELCPAPSAQLQAEESSIRNSGLQAFAKYKLGASGPRWMCGTFSAHMSLERLINSFVSSKMKSMSPLDSELHTIQTSLFTDARVGTMSIVSTTMEGVTTKRAKKGEKHLVLLPSSAGLDVMEGVSAARRDRSVQVCRYETSGVDEDNSVQSILRKSSTPIQKLHITLYMDTTSFNQSVQSPQFEADLSGYMASLCSPLKSITAKSSNDCSVTLIINDPLTFTSKFSSTRAILSSLNSVFPDFISTPSSSIQFLLVSSFRDLPYLHGLQGGFFTGSKYLVEKVQFLGQGIMYTAMMPPASAALAEASIKTILKGGGDGVAS